jgi:hypothetical protein
MASFQHIELNGFRFLLTDFNAQLDLMLDLSDEKIAKAITERNPEFLSALEELTKNYDEIYSVFWAEYAWGSWFQSPYANTLHKGLQQIINSKYASKSLKELAQHELDSLR